LRCVGGVICSICRHWAITFWCDIITYFC
jgi:hypothetical protein